MNTNRGISGCKPSAAAGLLVLVALLFGSSHAQAQQLLGPVSIQGNINGYTGVYVPSETLTVSVPHCLSCSISPFAPLPVSSMFIVVESPIGFAQAVVFTDFISQATVTIPLNTRPGQYHITAFATGPQGQRYTSAPAAFYVSGLTATARIEPGIIRFRFSGEQIRVRVLGPAPGGVTVDMTEAVSAVYPSPPNNISYTTTNQAVATVDPFGTVTAMGPGTASVGVILNQVSYLIPVYVPSTIRGDLNGDGQVDQDDVNILQEALNTKATGLVNWNGFLYQATDARDLNGDGVIDALDAQILVTLCTNPGCATIGASPATTIQTSPAGLQFTVDGGAMQTAPQTLNLTQGPHTIAVSPTQAGGAGTQYVFTGWSDGGAVSHSIAVGASAATYTATFKTVVNTPPKVTVPANIKAEATGPNGAVVTFTASATDIVDGTDPVTCTPSSGTVFPITFPPTAKTVTCSAKDKAGLTGSASFTVTIVDTTPPVLSNVPGPIKVEETSPAGTRVTVPLPTATDLVDTRPVVTSDAPALFPRGMTTVTFTATDFSGNKAKATTTVTVVDTTPPTTSATPTPDSNTHGWNDTDVTVMLHATDSGGSGVKQIAISLSGAQTGSNIVAGDSAGVKITADGTTTLTYFATDNAGNVERAKTLTVKIDKTRPVISGMPVPGCKVPTRNNGSEDDDGGNLVKIATVTAADVLSGLVAGSLKVTGTSNQPSDHSQDPQIVITPNGSGGFVVKVLAESSGDGSRVYTLTATASDLAGNTATVTGACMVSNRKD